MSNQCTKKRHESYEDHCICPAHPFDIQELLDYHKEKVVTFTTDSRDILKGFFMKKMLIASLLVAGTACAPMFALKSITDMFKDERLTVVSEDMKVAAVRKQAIEQLTAQVETPYNTLNQKYGDAQTRAFEETMHTQLLNFFNTALTKTVQKADYQAFSTNCTDLYTYVSSKSGAVVDEVQQFVTFIIAQRTTVAGMQFSFDHINTPVSKQQELAIQGMLQQLNNVIFEFMAHTMKIEFAQEEAPAQA